jgi:hypothetical protein
MRVASLGSIVSQIQDSVLPLFYEEVEVTRYTVVAGSAFTVPDPTTGLSDHHIDEIAAPGVLDSAQPILFFRTTHEGQAATMTADLNDATLLVEKLTDAGPHSWHLVAPAGTLRADNNEVTFGVETGEGGVMPSVTFSDVVLFYVSTQLTVKKRRPRPVNV